MKLRLLSANLETVLARITQTHLERYNMLRNDLSRTNVSSNLGYQCVFNGFYKMQRRSEDWHRYYFALLESKKGDASVTFHSVIEKIFVEKARVEPSFSSKLVATIRPEMPVYDKHVRENLSLKIPGAHKPAQERVKGFIVMYSSLEQKMEALVRDPIFTDTLKPAFDKKFGTYSNFTDVKKMDFLLWQYRKATKKP
jgi:hypothetical protein